MLRDPLWTRTERDAPNIGLECPTEGTQNVPGVMQTISTTSSVSKPTDKNSFLPKTYWYTGYFNISPQTQTHRHTHLTPRYRSMPNTKLSTHEINAYMTYSVRHCDLLLLIKV